MTCPRCSRPVTVTYSRNGTPRVAAHKCPHGVWCRAPTWSGQGREPCGVCRDFPAPAIRIRLAELAAGNEKAPKG